MLHACELTPDVRRAEEWLALADGFVARTNRVPISAICRTHYGGVLTAAGRWVDAERELTTSIEQYDRTYRALRGAAVVRLAALRVRQGRLAEAQPAMALIEARTALRVFQRLDANRDADAATSLLRRLGVRGHTGPRGTGTLTVREQEVLTLLGEGLSNPDIAARLFVSKRTAEHHVSNILAKLGLTTRAEAAAYAVKQAR
jgi:DNA-binding CsgD family transcriptional regulator